jgi:hypothetical protein
LLSVQWVWKRTRLRVGIGPGVNFGVGVGSGVNSGVWVNYYNNIVDHRWSTKFLKRGKIVKSGKVSLSMLNKKHNTE